MHVITELGWLLNPFFVILIGPFDDHPTPPTPFPFYSPRDVLLYSSWPGLFCTRDTSIFVSLSCLALSVAVAWIQQFLGFSHPLCSVPG